MKKFIYLVFAVILVVAFYLVMRQKPEQVETVVLTPSDFVETLSIDGKIRSRTKKIVYAFATGDLEAMSLKVGDIVAKGQVVTKLDWDFVVSVKSPIAGVVSKIFRESAGPIVRGEPIFEISSLEDLEVVVEMQTPDAIRLSPKGEVKIFNWGGEGELEGEIAQISRAGAVKTSALGVEEEKTEVRIQFNKIPAQLKNKFGDTYHVDAMFIISQDKNVLTLPLGALFKSNDNWAVYTAVDGLARLRSIEISKKNDRAAIVTVGLQAGDRVILFPGDKIREGTRVKF
jgi:HlyD family secretion protein